jgi:hypothetical protein
MAKVFIRRSEQMRKEKSTNTHITIRQVMKLNPCQKYSLQRVRKLFGERETLSYREISKLNIPDEDKIWILVKNHFLTHRQQIMFAIYCAKSALPVWNKRYPKDRRPAEAIKAAYAVLNNPSNENIKIARFAFLAAADAAVGAATATTENAAYAASDAAYVAVSPSHAALFSYGAALNSVNMSRKSQITYLLKMIGSKK